MSLSAADSLNHPPTPSQPADLVPHSPFLSHISHESRIGSDSDADDDTRSIRRLQSRANASQPPEGPSAPTSPRQQKTDDSAATATALPLSFSLTLQNTGSVARDHLASERTFLAYVRTSLSFASAGVALVQLFRVSVNVSTNDLPNSEIAPYARPLGATLIAFGMAVLALGTVRYFTIQRALPQGLFPAARLSIFLQAVSLATVVGIIFGILVAVH